jgi:hypothetical protein
MARLDWGISDLRFYETGIDRGVFYVDDLPGVAWPGLTSIEESPSGGEPQSYYLDGEMYAQVSSLEEFEATLNAFTYPDEFSICDGTTKVRTGLYLTQQSRKSFGLSYRTMIGNGSEVDHGYKIHIIHNALASPTQRSYSTINDSIEPIDFSWKIKTRPPSIFGYKSSSHIIIDSRYTDPDVLAHVEDILYGTETNTATIPTFDELVDVFDAGGELTVVDNGDGTFTATVPFDAFRMLDSDTFEITWPTAIFIDEDSYTLSSS